VSQNSKTSEPTDETFGVGDYVGDNSHSQIQNNCPIGGVEVYA